MTRAFKTAGAVCALCLMLIALSFHVVSIPQSAPSSGQTAAQTAAQTTVQTAAQQKTGAAQAPAGSVDLSVLFPDLDVSAITAVSVSTPERSFEFRSDSANTVTVNGGAADHEIYHTLLSQIAELPVSSLHALPADASRFLTLVVTAGAERHFAQFYSGTGAEAFILCGTRHAPQYRQTDAWRIGTLMMTCEGTRMDDMGVIADNSSSRTY